MNHYPRHVGDYIRDTVGLTMLEEGAYTRLLDQYYAREGPLPADASVYRIARATSKAERAAVDTVLKAYFTKTKDGWRQKRADLELDAQHERSESARQSAKRKWEKRNAILDANASANAMRTHMPTHNEGICETDAKSMLASSQKPDINPGLSSGVNEPVDNSASNPSAINAEKQVKTTSTPREWWRTNDGIEAKGRELGMPAKRGEDWPVYKDRLFAAINRGEQAV